MIEEKIKSLTSKLSEVMEKRKELSVEADRQATLAVKLQGAIEVLDSMKEESDKKEEK